MIYSPLFVIELLAGIIINYFYPNLELTVENAFFAVRIVRVLNSLPDDVVSADSLPLFVGRLRSVDLGGFIVGRS